MPVPVPAPTQTRALTAGAPSVAPPRTRGPIARRIAPATTQLKLVYLLWFVFLFDPQWVLAGKYNIRAALKLPMIITVTLTISLLINPSKGDWLVGLLLWVLSTAVNMPFVLDSTLAMIPFRQMCFFYLLGIAVCRSVRTPREAAPILFMTCVGQYLWWAFWGIRYGQVPWHPNLANYDGYGPLMAVGVGPAYYFAMAAGKNKRLRNYGLAAAGFCIAGVINSFARGAVLGLGVTVGYIWLRSPRKGLTTMVLAGGALVVVLTATLVNGVDRGVDTKGNFWEEMSTMFDDSEGSTGDDRLVLWKLARGVFRLNPVFGVGPENFGANAYMYNRHNVPGFRTGEIGGELYDFAPRRLYGRALHSNYFQLLSEFGVVGCTIWVFMLFQFWWRNWALHKPAAVAKWKAGGGETDLRLLAIGLESGMVSFMVTGVFFNQLFVPWFYTLLFANVVLYSLTTEPKRGKNALKPLARPFARSPLPAR